nr:carbamoyltransferase N-terminal domain-containing protein [Alicyclobacillus herbarius]
MKRLLVLGIETSCDETAAAIVRDGRLILAQTIASQMQVHAQFGGVVPEVASRRHVTAVTRVIAETLAEAGLRFADLDAIAVTYGPGLLGALLVGVSAAKGLALATGLPIIGVHHIAGHVAAALLVQPTSASKEGLAPASAVTAPTSPAGVAPASSGSAPAPLERPARVPAETPTPAATENPTSGETGETAVRLPVLALVVSGGHTEILQVDEQFGFTRLGGTIDDAAGEAYDKVARLLGLTYPGGPKLDQLAQGGNSHAFAFPRSLIEEANFDFSFSGLKTAVANELNRRRQKGEAVDIADVAASFQQAVCDVLVEKTARAVQTTNLRHVVVAGGVAANQGLRQALRARAESDGFSVVFPPLSLCTDNAAMIAAAGYYALRRGLRHDLNLNAHATVSLSDWQSGRVV